jgi:hypothetical protein
MLVSTHFGSTIQTKTPLTSLFQLWETLPTQELVSLPPQETLSDDK